MDSYPSARDFDRRTNTHNPREDTFSDFHNANFILAVGRVSRRQLHRLDVAPYQRGILERGIH